MTNESFNLRKIEVEILNKKVYKSLLDKHKNIWKIKGGAAKEPEINDKIILITEDLLKEIGISEMDYYESPKAIKKLRENRSQTYADENEESLNQQDDENKEKNEDKKDLDKSESGSDFSLNEEDDDEKSIKNDKNKEENDEQKENKEEKKENKEDNKKEEQKEEIKKEKKAEKDKNKDKAENYYTKKEPEIFKSEKWNEFYNIIEFKYQLGNCIFLVDNNLFYRFPKRFICYGLDCSDINTNELDEEKIESKIEELLYKLNILIN
jgi:hypothetical protein